MSGRDEGTAAAPRLATRLQRFFLRSDDRRLVDAMESGLQIVEQRLLDNAGRTDAVADSAGRYLLEAGGKRVRPLLCLLASQLGGGIDDRVIDAATVVELTHVASLYHDDVMDEADIRRGVASAHRVWGNNVAILAGDILFSRASLLTSHLGERAIVIQANTFYRLCQGQLRETIGPGEGDDPIEHYLGVLADKTGSLIAAAGELGVLLGDAPEEYVRPIREYGERVGVAFQLIDDVIDLRSSSAELGKTPGTDLREGVPTLPMLLLERQASSDADAAATLAKVRELLADDATLNEALGLLASHAATARARDTARRWASSAKSALDPLPDGSVKRLLHQLADYIVDRSH